MGDILKGNFKTKKEVKAPEVQEDAVTKFEQEALKRLGGSIAFVSKKKFLFGMDKEKTDGGAGA